MSVLLTGAAGFIGSHVAERLLARGEEVVGLDLFDDFYDPEMKEQNLEEARDFSGFTLVRGDIRDADLLASLPDGIDSIVHLAARAGVRPSIAQPSLYVDVNIRGTMMLLELAKERAIPHFVFASSSSVYGDRNQVPFSETEPVDHPISPYAATKRAGELLCHTSAHLDGLSAICLRFFTVYGPRQRPDLAIRKFTELMDEGRPIPMFGDGSTERDYTYIDDIIQGVEGALRYVREREGICEIVNLGGSGMISLREMIEGIAEAMGVEPIIERFPLQPGDVTRTCADVRKAERLLGYRPTTDFHEGIRRFAEWWQMQGRPAGVS